MLPFVAGTMAIFDVIAPSPAFNVDTNGFVSPFDQSVRKLKALEGTTVALKT